MGELFINGYTLDDNESLFSFSKEKSLLINSSISFQLKNEELCLEKTESDDKNRYFVNISKENGLKNKNNIVKKNIYSSGSSTFSGFQNAPLILFKISKIISYNQDKKFKGRKRKNPITDDIGKKHDKFTIDNIVIKIQVYFLDSMIQFVNEIISKTDLGDENKLVFNKIDYSFKKNVNNKTFEENKKRTIAYFLEIEISKKYTLFSSDSNKKKYEKIKNNEIIKNILSITYIDFFREIFYKNKRAIDLSKYGTKKMINLSNKVKLYEDMFKGKIVNDKYKYRVEEVIKQKFLI